MSTNVSLANPGTSLNFDGQALQNQQEAEIEREEQLQQNELRQLLSKEFDDLDDDILSVGSSEDDSVNNSHISLQQDSYPAGRHGDQQPALGGTTTTTTTTSIGLGSAAAAATTSATVTASQTPQSVSGSHHHHHHHHHQAAPQWPAKLDKDAASQAFQSARPPAWPASGQWDEGEGGTGDEGGSGWTRMGWGGGGGGQGAPPPASVPYGIVPSSSSSVPSYSASVRSPAIPAAQSWSSQDSTHPPGPYGVACSSAAPAYANANSDTHHGPQAMLGALQWGDHHHHHHHDDHDATPHPDSQPSATRLQPHPYPSYPFSSTATVAGDSFVSQPGDEDGQPASVPFSAHHHFRFDGGGVGPSPGPTAAQPGAGEVLAADFTRRSWEEKVAAGLGGYPSYDSNNNSNSNSNIRGLNNGDVGGLGVSTGLLPSQATGLLPGQATGLLPSQATGLLPSQATLQGLPSSAGAGTGSGDSENAAYFAHVPASHRLFPVAFADSGGWDGGEGLGGGVATRDVNGGDQATGAHSALSGVATTTAGGDDFDRYTVQYRKPGPSSRPAGDAAGSELKVKFITQEGDSEETAQLSQLQLLYRARGRQLEDTKEELNSVTQDSARERRRLKHLLSVATGEREGMALSLKQCQQLLQEVKDDQTQTATQLTSAQAQVQALLANKEELGQKLQSAETTIENLSHQVAGLQGTDSLTQARRQHEAVVSSMQQRFDAQLLDLKQQLDSANEAMVAKVEEVARLQAQVRQQTKLAEDAQISRGETINQLTRSLEESQQRCQALLAASSNEESSKLRAQLQQSLVAKKMSDEMCTSMQAEVKELKEQLTMLESAASLGAISTPLSGAFADDSISDLGIRKTLDFSTPETPTRLDASSSTADELVGKLRRELERCVHSNRAKRSQLLELQQQGKLRQAEMEQLQREVAESRQTVQEQRAKLSGYEERLGGSLQPSAVEARLTRDLDNLRLENQALLKDVEEYKVRLKEVGSNEEMLTEMNGDLKRQIAAMVAQHDQDKQEALNRCRQVSEDAHQAAREKLEHKLRSEMFADKQEVIMKYEEQLTASRERLREAVEELDKVKDLYIQTSRDLTRQEQEVRDKEQELQEAVASEKKRAESELQVAMETQWQQRLAEERSRWQEEQQAEREEEEAWQRRLAEERVAWEAQRDPEWEKRLEAERVAWGAESEAEWAERLKRERAGWQVAADREALDQSDAAVEHARRRWQQEAGERLQRVAGELEQCRQQHKAELVAMETRWGREVAEKEADLERRVQSDVEAEVAARLAEQKSRLEEQAREALELRLTEEKQRHEVDVRRAVNAAREEAVAGTQQRAERDKQAAVEAARAVWHAQHHSQASQAATQEVAKWKEEAQKAQAELVRQQESWHSERGKLTAEKDEDRRRAVADVRTECQADLERVMEEAKATLDAALQRHRHEMEELEARYKHELAALRAAEEELRQAAPPPPPKDSHSNSSGRGGDPEVARLRKEVAKRDRLLQQADDHMAREVQRLRESLAQQYDRQREHDTQERRLELLHSASNRKPEEEARDSEDLAAELRQAEAELASLRRGAESALKEAESALKEAESARKEAESAQREAESARKEAESAQREAESARKEAESAQREAERLEEEGRQAEDRLARQLAESRREAQAEGEARGRAEEKAAGLEQRVERGRARAGRLEAALKAVNRQHQEDVQRLEETLTATHSQQLADLAAQLAQAHKQRAAELTELESEHKAEQRALVEELERRHLAETHSLMEEVRRQTKRVLANTPTQTDKDDSLYSLKDQYLSLMQKMKVEVMDHINRSNERAALTMKTEIRMERQRTTDHLLRRCKARLPHILLSLAGRSPEKGAWTQLDHALDSLFDSVASSSCSASTSAAVTPRSSEEGGDPEDGDSPGGRGVPRGVASRSAPPTLPASSSSEQHSASLPSALLSRVHFESDSSSAEPPSGVFYPLEPDDTASVSSSVNANNDNSSDDNDSEPELSALAPLSKRAARAGGGGGGSGVRQRRQATPPKKVKAGLSVFVGQNGGGGAPFLLSPKLHRQREEEEEEGWWRDADGSGGAWKEAGGGAEGWAAAVGHSSSLWRAFQDLRCLELLDEQDADSAADPRRRLRFTSQSALDDSSASSSSSRHRGELRRRGHHDPKPRPPALLSRSEDFTEGRGLSSRQSSTGPHHHHHTQQPRLRRLSPQPAVSADPEEPRRDRPARVISRFSPQSASSGAKARIKEEEEEEEGSGGDGFSVRPQHHHHHQQQPRAARHSSASPEKPFSRLPGRRSSASPDKTRRARPTSPSPADPPSHQPASSSSLRHPASRQEGSGPGHGLLSSSSSSKALLNPRDFVTQSVANRKSKMGGGGTRMDSSGSETLDSMLARLGIGGAGGGGHISNPHFRSRSAGCPGQHQAESGPGLLVSDAPPAQSRASSAAADGVVVVVEDRGGGGDDDGPHAHRPRQSQRTRSAESVASSSSGVVVDQPHHLHQQHHHHYHHRQEQGRSGTTPQPHPAAVSPPQASSQGGLRASQHHHQQQASSQGGLRASQHHHQQQERRRRPSSQKPKAQQHQQPRRGERSSGRPDRDLDDGAVRLEGDSAVRRSLEDLRQALRAHPAAPLSLSLAGKAKSRSEQALHVLGGGPRSKGAGPRSKGVGLKAGRSGTGTCR